MFSMGWSMAGICRVSRGYAGYHGICRVWLNVPYYKGTMVYIGYSTLYHPVPTLYVVPCTMLRPPCSVYCMPSTVRCTLPDYVIGQKRVKQSLYIPVSVKQSLIPVSVKQSLGYTPSRAKQSLGYTPSRAKQSLVPGGITVISTRRYNSH